MEWGLLQKNVSNDKICKNMISLTKHENFAKMIHITHITKNIQQTKDTVI